MEQGTGIEPAFTAWEAVVLPIYEPCVGEGIIAKGYGKSNHFLSKTFRAFFRKKPFVFAFFDKKIYNSPILYKLREFYGRAREKI